MPSPDVSLTGMLLNTTEASTTSGLGDIGDGTTLTLGADLNYRLGDMPGGMTLAGLWAFDNDFDEIGGLNISPDGAVSVDSKRNAWGLSLSGWQYFYTEDEAPAAIDRGDGRQDLEGLGAFAILGLGDRDTNPVSWSAAVGVSGRGTIPGRGNDTWGVGYFYNSVQEPDTVLLDGLESSTQGFEAYYNIALAGSASLTLDFQWTKSAIDEIDDAVILGLRLHISF
jgi:hypothetical protein